MTGSGSLLVHQGSLVPWSSLIPPSLIQPMWISRLPIGVGRDKNTYFAVWSKKYTPGWFVPIDINRNGFLDFIIFLTALTDRRPWDSHWLTQGWGMRDEGQGTLSEPEPVTGPWVYNCYLIFPLLILPPILFLTSLPYLTSSMSPHSTFFILQTYFTPSYWPPPPHFTL